MYHRFKLFISFFIFHLLIVSDTKAQCFYSGSAFTASTVISNIQCASNDGSITINALNGYKDTFAVNRTAYTYAITAGPVTRPSQSSNIFSALTAGNYTVTVTDCNGTVVIFAGSIITGTTPTALTITPTVFKGLCASNNAIKLGLAGGKQPYTISITNAPAGSSPVISGDTIRGLAVGSLTTSITDACGNMLTPTNTITTNPAMPANTAITSSLSYFNCAGAAGYGRSGGTPVPMLDYYVGLTTIVPNLVTDSFFTTLSFNGTLMQTIYPVTAGAYFGGAAVISFNGYGFGKYTLNSYYKCGTSGSTVNFKRDSVVIGNLPATTVGTNTNLGGNLSTIKYRCTNYDQTYTFRYGLAFQSRITTPGEIFNTMNAPLTATIISGPAAQIGNTFRNVANNVTFTDLLYSNAYVVQIKDTCGVTDTVYFNTPIQPFVKMPTANFSCTTKPSSVLGAFSPMFGISRINFPPITPLKYTFISGTDIPWISGPSYPITIVDSLDGLQQISWVATKPNATYTIAYENGCNQKDTTVWTVNCTPYTPGIVAKSFIQQCGNTGNIILTNATTNTKLNVFLKSGPAGNSIPANAMTASATSATYYNQPSGTYTFVANMASLNVSPGYANNLNLSEGGATAAQTNAYGYPLLYANRPKVSINYAGTVDTAKLRVWDTTFTVVIPLTNLISPVPHIYVCKNSAQGTSILAHASGGVFPYSFSYSTVGTSGPYTNNTPVNDSLFNIGGMPNGTPVWIKTTDACGNTAITTSTVAALNSTYSSSCTNGIATISPNPFNASFNYELVKSSTGEIYSFSYPTKPTIDLNVPENAGQYVIRYRLKSGAGNTGCVADSVIVVATNSCNLYTLPVTFKSFTATINNCNALLAFSTASEQNSDYYQVEHSADGSRFLSIANIKSANDISGQNYTNTFAGLLNGINYFRIKAIDIDGKFIYSRIIILNNNCNTSKLITIAPNPVKDAFSITGLSGKNTITLSDISGRVVKTIVSINSTQYLNIDNFSPGTYFLRISGERGNIDNFKIIKAIKSL